MPGGGRGAGVEEKEKKDASLQDGETTPSKRRSSCRFCGHQMDIYGERILTLMQENKNLVMDNREYKAEVTITW